MWWTTKKIQIPAETKEIEAVELWSVRWYSRHGEYSAETKPVMEAFASKEDAELFAQSLRDAFALIKHTSGNKVTVAKME